VATIVDPVLASTVAPATGLPSLLMIRPVSVAVCARKGIASVIIASTNSIRIRFADISYLEFV
jgi:C4-dicarboxylate transporter